jgi:hypothetical protein
VCRSVWPRLCGKREGCRSVVVGVRAHNRGESFTVARQRGVAGRVRYGLWLAKEGTGRRYVGWVCWINLDMVGIKYVRAK